MARPIITNNIAEMSTQILGPESAPPLARPRSPPSTPFVFFPSLSRTVCLSGLLPLPNVFQPRSLRVSLPLAVSLPGFSGVSGPVALFAFRRDRTRWTSPGPRSGGI